MRLIGPGGLIAALMFLAMAASAETKRVFTVPPVQWDQTMSRDRPAQIHGPRDLANLTGGIVFGLSPEQVNALLPRPSPGTEWAGLPFANEYPNDIRYFWAPMNEARELREGIRGCLGENSYIVFLFRERGLFRISWRLLPDAACPSVRDAAEDIYARFLTIDRAAAVATHYKAGKGEAVEITDPGTGYLMPYRWENRQRR